MPWEKPAFMPFDGQTRAGVVGSNLTYDGHARFAVLHGDRVLCVQTALLGSNHTAYLRGVDFNVQPFGDTSTSDALSDPVLPGNTAASSRSTKDSKKTKAVAESLPTGISLEELHNSSDRPVELTSALFIRPGRPSSSIAEYEHSFSSSSARIVTAVEASSRKPARLLLWHARFPSGPHSPVAVFAFSNASLTGGQPVAHVAALAQMASPIHPHGVLLAAASTGHVLCLALPEFNAPVRTDADNQTLEHVVTMGPLRSQAVDVCGDVLSLPYAAACDEEGGVVAWMLTHSRNGVTSCDEVFSRHMSSNSGASVGAARVVRMRGGVLVVGDDQGCVAAYNLEIGKGKQNEINNSDTSAHDSHSSGGSLVGVARVCAAPITAMDVSHCRDWVVVGGEDCRVHVLQFPRAPAPCDEQQHAAQRAVDRPILLFSVAINVPVLGLSFTEPNTLNPSFCASLMEMPYLCFYRHVSHPADGDSKEAAEPAAVPGARSAAPRSRALSRRESDADDPSATPAVASSSTMENASLVAGIATVSINQEQNHQQQNQQQEASHQS